MNYSAEPGTGFPWMSLTPDCMEHLLDRFLNAHQVRIAY
jgi:hypothetical protein